MYQKIVNKSSKRAENTITRAKPGLEKAAILTEGHVFLLITNKRIIIL
jgi:hypothetical protein